jgi:hypothetical protein
MINISELNQKKILMINIKKQRDILGKLNLKELISIGEKEFNQNYGKKALPTFFQDILDAGTRLKAGLPKIMVGLNMSEAGMTIDEQIKKNIATSESGFIFNPSTGDSFSANPSAAEMLLLLKEGKNASDIKKIFLEKYEVDAGQLERDWDDFLAQLREGNLMEY